MIDYSYFLKTRAEARLMLAARLKAAGVDTAPLDARLLVQAACGIDDAALIAHGGKALGFGEAFRLSRHAARRVKGEPVSRILGRKEFWGMEFRVTRDTLDPRPDTETLVEAALRWARAENRPLRVLDLGTGTGCILISLLHELPAATGVGVDISAGAVRVSHENAARLGVGNRTEFRRGSWFGALESGESFDLIVSNPPYIRESDMESLAKEVGNHDPRTALTDGKDGFETYETIYPQLRRWLKPGGRAFFEMGFDQGADMRRLIENHGATLCSIYKDLGGRERVVELIVEK